jgi:hypothetical protein
VRIRRGLSDELADAVDGGRCRPHHSAFGLEDLTQELQMVVLVIDDEYVQTCEPIDTRCVLLLSNRLRISGV